MTDRNFPSAWQPQLLSLLRIMAGLLLLQYGTAKILGFPHWDYAQGIKIFSLVGIAGLIELIGGALFTPRPVHTTNRLHSFRRDGRRLCHRTRLAELLPDHQHGHGGGAVVLCLSLFRGCRPGPVEYRRGLAAGDVAIALIRLLHPYQVGGFAPATTTARHSGGVATQSL
jgi:hypothetical protein